MALYTAINCDNGSTEDALEHADKAQDAREQNVCRPPTLTV